MVMDDSAAASHAAYWKVELLNNQEVSVKIKANIYESYKWFNQSLYLQKVEIILIIVVSLFVNLYYPSYCIELHKMHITWFSRNSQFHWYLSLANYILKPSEIYQISSTSFAIKKCNIYSYFFNQKDIGFSVFAFSLVVCLCFLLHLRNFR